MKLLFISKLILFCCFLFVPSYFPPDSWIIVQSNNAPANRSECGMAAVNGKLYLIGGDGGEAKAVECYDPQTRNWTTLAIAPSVMHHFQAVAYQNKIYVLEAFDKGGFPNQDPMEQTAVYDAASNSWRRGAGLPAGRRRAGAGAAVYQDKLFLVAGITHGHSSGTTNMFDEYDPATDTWKTLPDAPHIRDHCSATVINNKLYAVGGRNTSYHEPDNFMAFFSHTETTVDCYDFKTGQWTVLDSKLPQGSGGGAVVNYKNILYYMGGERATAAEHNAPRKNVYWLDPAIDKGWKEMDSLQKARNGMAAAVCNNRIYVAGGSGGGPGGPPPGNPAAGKQPPQAPPSPGSQRVNDKIVLEEMQHNE